MAWGGGLFTGPNGRTLFLPAAGCRWDDELNNAGDFGDYWSSSLDTVAPRYAWLFNFGSYSAGVNYYSRSYGRSVRAVRSARQN